MYLSVKSLIYFAWHIKLTYSYIANTAILTTFIVMQGHNNNFSQVMRYFSLPHCDAIYRICPLNNCIFTINTINTCSFSNYHPTFFSIFCLLSSLILLSNIFPIHAFTRQHLAHLLLNISHIKLPSTYFLKPWIKQYSDRIFQTLSKPSSPFF